MLYLDDIILTGNNQDAITALITALQFAFELKDFGRLTYFLGLQINYCPSCLFVHQTKYATDILTLHNMLTAKPCSTPFVPLSRHFSSNSTSLLDPYVFRSLVGALQYLTFARPDLSYAVNSLCQHMHRPTTAHLIPAKRVLRLFLALSHVAFYFNLVQCLSLLLRMSTGLAILWTVVLLWAFLCFSGTI